MNKNGPDIKPAVFNNWCEHFYIQLFFILKLGVEADREPTKQLGFDSTPATLMSQISTVPGSISSCSAILNPNKGAVEYINIPNNLSISKM